MQIRYLIYFIILGWVSASAWSAEICAPIIITHPMKQYDPFGVARAGIENEIRRLDQSGCTEKKYLIGTPTDRMGYLSKNTGRSINERSANLDGTHSFLIEGDSVIVVGGYYGQCHYWTIRDIVRNRISAKIFGDLRVVIPEKAVYYSNLPKNLRLDQWFESLEFSPKKIPEGLEFYEIAGRLIEELKDEAIVCVQYQLRNAVFQYGDTHHCQLNVVLDFIP